MESRSERIFLCYGDKYSLSITESKHEQQQKRNYNRRIMNIEHGTFTPLFFSVSGGMGKECSMFHKRVAERLTIKTGERYKKIISTIQCVISNPQISFDVCKRKSKS